MMLVMKIIERIDYPGAEDRDSIGTAYMSMVTGHIEQRWRQFMMLLLQVQRISVERMGYVALEYQIIQEYQHMKPS